MDALDVFACLTLALCLASLVIALSNRKQSRRYRALVQERLEIMRRYEGKP